MEKFFINLTKEHYSICGMTATICCRRAGQAHIYKQKKNVGKIFYERE